MKLLPEFDILTSCSDEDLISRFRAGQQEVFGLLVKRYQRELYGYLRRYLRDAELADDVFQSTFLQMFVKMDQYEAGRPFRPWLYRIAINQAIDAQRRIGRHPAVSLEMAPDAADGDERSLTDLIESREGDPLDHLHAEERRQLVRGSIDRLPQFLRQVVMLAYYQGLKYREIAEIMELPVGTVKSRLHTALSRLTEALSQTPSVHEL